MVDFRTRPIPVNEPARVISWNMQRGGKTGGKTQTVRDTMKWDDTAFVLLQEINYATYESLITVDTFVPDNYYSLFCEADVRVAGLGQAMFVRRCYGGNITNQTALDTLANGRSNPIWVSSDGKREVVGIHAMSGGANAIRVEQLTKLLTHCNSLAYSHIVCGDLNMAKGIYGYDYVAGEKHLNGSILDGCLTAAQKGWTVPYVESVGDGGLYGSDHPLCQYLVTWEPRRA